MLSKFLTKRKTLLFLMAFMLLFFSFSKMALAFSGPTVRGGYHFNFENAVYKTEEMNLQSFVNETLKATVSSVITSVVGCFSCTPEEREKYPGFLLAAGHLMVGMYTSPPASGVDYLADMGQKLGVVKPAYAQEEGIGFNAMERIRPIWTAFRNISYVLFVLILVFIGFAIMFRVKINPQTVISLQSALPKIVIALILITFSYAIVGLMIDLMLVFSGLITNLFIGGEGVMRTIGGVSEIMAEISTFVGQLAPHSPVIAMHLANGLFFTLAIVVSLVAAILLGPLSWLIAIVAIILILIAILRCVWAMLKAYAMIIVSLIFAPLQILIGTLPGSDAISSWFRGLIGNIAVFPAMLAMFYIAAYLMLSGVAEIFSDPTTLIVSLISGWIPGAGAALTSVLVLNSFESFWHFTSALLLPIIGLMILLMAPKVTDMINSFLAGKPFEYGSALGEAFGPARLMGGIAAGPGLPFVAQRFMYEKDWGRADSLRRALLRTGEAGRRLAPPETE